MIRVQCRCGRRLELHAAQTRRAGRCPHCRTPMLVIAPGHDDTQRENATALLNVGGPMPEHLQVFLAGAGPITVGKAPECDLRLNDQRASRKHCTLTRTPAGWLIEDQHSTNGVLLNDRRITSGRLADGDFLRLGDCEFKIVESDGHTPAVDPPTRPQQAKARPPLPSEAAAEHEAEDAPALPDLIEQQPAKPSPAIRPAAALDDGLIPLADLEDAAPLPEIDPIKAAKLRPRGQAALEADQAGPEVACPSCRKQYPCTAKICVACGIDLRTGRAIITTTDTNLDEIYATAEGVIRGLSWLIPFGIYPVASEAFGTAKPYVIRGIAALTTVVSIWFYIVVIRDFVQGNTGPQHLMLWSGTISVQALEDAGLEPEDFDVQNWSDLGPEAFDPEEYGFQRFRPYQLITHAFLHAGLFHLAGNMLFLLVLGSRVNALMGHLWTPILYLVLAVLAALAHMASTADQLLHPMIGASGAVMGLAGMYLVFFPVHPIHMALWYRFGIIGRFSLHETIFAVRGFWVVLFYIAFDVFATLWGSDDGVAHWAHLGGFVAGMILALALLLCRQAKCRGSDILSVLLGRHAWKLIGPPSGSSVLP